VPGTTISTLPETLCTATRRPPLVPINTLPPTALTSAPPTASNTTTPDTAATVAESARFTCTDELFVITRHAPAHAPMSIGPDFDRTSTRVASSM
jgi:hypothetical protein